MGKLAILEMVLFDEPSNKWRATRGVADVFRWWVSTNLESTKQWVHLESMRARNGILLRWFWPRIKGEVREMKSELGSERVDTLSQIRLIAAQRSSTQLSVCAESWRSLSIFLRVSRKQLPEYQQLLKHYGLWKRPWSVSWDRSPACGLLHRSRGTDCFRDTSCARHWSTCHCWSAWKRDLPVEYWVAFWKQRTEMTWRKSSWWIRPPETDLFCSGRSWQNWR